MALRDIKEKIESVKRTAKVTKAMESVSAVKMRKAQEVALTAREYAFFAFWALKRLTAATGKDVSEFFLPKTGDKTGIIIISPDKGLAGAINTNLFKKLEHFITEREYSSDKMGFITVGKKARSYVARNGYENIHEPTDPEMTELEMLEEVGRVCSDLFINGEYREFYIFYTRFVTTTEQTPTIRHILPITTEGLQRFISEIVPTKGKYADKAEEFDFEKQDSGDYEFEPDAETVLKSMLPYMITTSLYYSLLESQASEHSARMVAMKNATDKAADVAKELKRKFNKQRQAAITQEISEITSGMETTQ